MLVNCGKDVVFALLVVNLILFLNIAELPAPLGQKTVEIPSQKDHTVDIQTKWLPQEFDRGQHSLF